MAHCMMTVANPMAYIPLGERLPAVHLLHFRKATKGRFLYPWWKTGTEGTEVSLQEVILADTVTGLLERTRSIAEVGVRTHDEAEPVSSNRDSFEGGGEPAGNIFDADCGALETHEEGSIPGPPTEVRLESINRRVVEAPDQCTRAGVCVSDCVWGR